MRANKAFFKDFMYKVAIGPYRPRDADWTLYFNLRPIIGFRIIWVRNRSNSTSIVPGLDVGITNAGFPTDWNDTFSPVAL